MGSVLSQITCRNCGYKDAQVDYYYKSDEEYIFCEKCGYSYSRTAKTDKAKGKRIHKQLKECLKDKDYDKGMKIAKNEYMLNDNSDTEKIRAIKDKIQDIENYNFELYFKKDRDGIIQYEEKETIPLGAYRIMFRGGGGVGNYVNKEFIKDIEKRYKKGEIENNRGEKATEIKYTFSKGNVWFEKDVISGKVKQLDKREVQKKIEG